MRPEDVRTHIDKATGRGASVGGKSHLRNTKIPINSNPETPPLAPLMPFDTTARTDWAIPFSFEDYLETARLDRSRSAPSQTWIYCGKPAENIGSDRQGFDDEAIIKYASRLSALSYLHRFHVQQIKIDKSFVQGITEDNDKA
jgi:hypothetical protein